MPVWHEKTKQWVKEGRLVVIGVTQEQHPQRCRLFAQWQQIDWPILHDPINILQVEVVPMFIALDEHGIVRSTRPRPESFEAEFLNRKFEDSAKETPAPLVQRVKQIEQESQFAQIKRAYEAQRDFAGLGDAILLWANSSHITDGIEAYRHAVKLDPADGDNWFRLGVAYRRRYESSLAQPGDFQAAVTSWRTALSRNPNQYIWRRRIQQYGPRLDKPYPFYDWVEQARADIKSRGQRPIELPVEPRGAELAIPSRSFSPDSAPSESPDPKGLIHRDTKNLVNIEATVVPATTRNATTCRVHVTLTPNAAQKAHWNNEVEPTRVWVDVPDGCKISRQLFTLPLAREPESSEVRRLEFELQTERDAADLPKLKAYALYHVCEDIDGVCQFLRKDFEIALK